jgi:protease-4
MRIVRTLVLTACVAAAAAAVAGEDLPLLDYRTDSWQLLQSPSVTAGPVGGLFNPGASALTDRAGIDFWWDDGDDGNGLDNFGFALGRELSLAMNRRTIGYSGGRARRDDWQIGALLAGGRHGTLGVAYRWSGGDDRLRSEQALAIGVTGRPGRALSFGASRVGSLESAAAQNVFDVGLRPWRSSQLTLFADWTANDDERFLADGTWGAGLEVRPLRGVQLVGRAREQAATGRVDYAVMVGLSGTAVQWAFGGVFDPDGEQLRNSYLVRRLPAFRSRNTDLNLFAPPRRYFALDLQNRTVAYQKFRWFDDETVAWLDLLRLLDAVRDEPRIDILALNLSGTRIRPSLLWELRGKLQEIRDAGKSVQVHADRLGMGGMYLAAAADRVTLDPQGGVSLPGVTLTRSYLKGTLEKIGLGFQEHRYFKYKSAAETLSRDHMSDADREQRRRIVDVIYEEMRDGIAAGRGRSAAEVDGVIDDLGVLTAAEALDRGLVDATARWEAELLRLQTELQAAPAPVPVAARRTWWDEQWGAPPRIPVVYAVGPCAMDTGIKGRATSAYLRSLARDPRVAAVVLRADSPGGDPLPSDLVAEAVRTLRAAGKPVVVSQGDVAASGGYWISMDGSRILTTPLTVTGSIGVISGWLWDDGAAARAGVTAEDVSRGRHADLYSEVRLPLVGGLPRRPMNDGELARAESVIRDMYGDFVQAVARGRGLDAARVDSLAQGRVWMGGDAVERGLCDGFGGLGDAIDEARRLAGIAPDREIELVEFPPRPWIKWPSFGPTLPQIPGLSSGLIGWFGRLGRGEPAPAGDVADPWSALGLSALETGRLSRIAASPGRPLLLTEPDLVPDAWRDAP